MNSIDGRSAEGVQVPESQLVVLRIPWILEFEPPAAIAVGATWIDTFTIPFLDFVITHLGFAAPSEGFPAGPSRWKIGFEDVGKSRSWQPHLFSTTALIGGNHGIGDQSAFSLSMPWRVAERGTVRIEIFNDGLFAGTPELVLHGYLDSAPPFRARSAGV